MGKCFLYGNSSGGDNILAYDTVCQTEEPAMKEGRIWIKSSTPATFIAVNAPWDNGTVGQTVITGTVGGDTPSTTNTTLLLMDKTIKGIEHSIQVSPTGCKQVQGDTGAWVDVDAYVCHSDTWVQFSTTWDGILFYNGNQYKDITGGWAGAGSTSSDLYTWTSGDGKTITFTTNKDIDLIQWNYINYIASAEADNSSGGTWSGYFYIGNKSQYLNSTAKTYKTSVSDLSSGKPKFTIGLKRNGWIRVSKVWLTK